MDELWIECRQMIDGFYTSGVFILMGGLNTKKKYEYALLDMNKPTLEDMNPLDAALVVGKTFTDSVSQVQIKVVASFPCEMDETATCYEVNVCKSACNENILFASSGSYWNSADSSLKGSAIANIKELSVLDWSSKTTTFQPQYLHPVVMQKYALNWTLNIATFDVFHQKITFTLFPQDHPMAQNKTWLDTNGMNIGIRIRRGSDKTKFQKSIRGHIPMDELWIECRHQRSDFASGIFIFMAGKNDKENMYEYALLDMNWKNSQQKNFYNAALTSGRNFTDSLSQIQVTARSVQCGIKKDFDKKVTCYTVEIVRK